MIQPSFVHSFNDTRGLRESTQGRLGGTRTPFFSCGVIMHRSHEDSKIQACRDGKKGRGGSQVEGLWRIFRAEHTQSCSCVFLSVFYGFKTQLSATGICPMKLENPSIRQAFAEIGRFKSHFRSPNFSGDFEGGVLVSTI
jgi:hypothetical protein